MLYIVPKLIQAYVPLGGSLLQDNRVQTIQVSIMIIFIAELNVLHFGVILSNTNCFSLCF